MSCGITSEGTAAAMTCHDVANHIHEYVDHTLPPGARHGVGEHLATLRGVRPHCQRNQMSDLPVEHVASPYRAGHPQAQSARRLAHNSLVRHRHCELL